ncbi:NBS-LRR type resistance protein [Cucumis melo var. makuwa]|uniref:NBS-LRR type resistance protein n=1 Tax=Cucumis melo var. makuwa TaxID=1194695 RepID=A0A5D3CE16_CUCMM|nr:NBS-LRR type resistance protein [Cucumis melo var. makuwa]
MQGIVRDRPFADIALTTSAKTSHDVISDYINSSWRTDDAINDGIATLTRFVEYQIFTVLKEFKGENHHHFKKFDDLEQARANPPPRLSNWKQSSMNKAAKGSSPTTTTAAPNCFYNENTSSLNSEVIQLTMWSYSRKHTLGVVSSFRRRLRMHIIKCWNSSYSLPRGFSTTLWGQDMRDHFG